jgi:hypothetical protein
MKEQLDNNIIEENSKHRGDLIPGIFTDLY